MKLLSLSTIVALTAALSTALPIAPGNESNTTPGSKTVTALRGNGPDQVPLPPGEFLPINIIAKAKPHVQADSAESLLVASLTPIAIKESSGIDYIYLLPTSTNTTNMDLTYNFHTKTIFNIPTGKEFLMLNNFVSLVSGFSLNTVTFIDPNQDLSSMNETEITNDDRVKNWDQTKGGKMVINEYYKGSFYACKDAGDPIRFSNHDYELIYSNQIITVGDCTAIDMILQFS